MGAFVPSNWPITHRSLRRTLVQQNMHEQCEARTKKEGREKGLQLTEEDKNSYFIRCSRINKILCMQTCFAFINLEEERAIIIC